MWHSLTCLLLIHLLRPVFPWQGIDVVLAGSSRELSSFSEQHGPGDETPQVIENSPALGENKDTLLGELSRR